MVRKLLAFIGVLELLAPDRVVATAERVALENPADCELRAWTLPMARLEALIWLLLAVRGDPHGRVRKLLALVCGPAALFPRKYINIGARLAYADPDRCEWTFWVVPATRAMGVLSIAAALRGRRQTDSDE